MTNPCSLHQRYFLFPRATDERYSMDEQGLHIKHITEDDNGLYICRASVVSLGSLKTRQITVDVYSKSIFSLDLTNFLPPSFRPLFSPLLSLSFPCAFCFFALSALLSIAAFRIRASLSRNFHAQIHLSQKKKPKNKRQQSSAELRGRRVDDKEIHGGGQRELRVSGGGQVHRQPQETRDPG